MSDVTQGPGWWQASDGKWYPPSTAPTPGPAVMAYRAPPRTSSMAIASLILGISSLVTCALTGIPGLITGIIARRQIRESNGAETGEGLALGGIVTSAIALGLVVLVVLAIFAITFLGKSASSKFSSVGSSVAG